MAPAPREASVALIVFGAVPDDVELALARFGIPSAAAAEACTVQRFEQASAGAWFEGWRTGSLRAIAAQDLGDASALLDGATVLHAISVDVVDAVDLTYLQAAWGLARWLVARGATCVLDAHAMKFYRGTELAPADAPLDLAREIRVVYETDSTRADRAHAIHTRGMRKFGLPDLVALCGDADAPLVGTALGELAEALARGAPLGSPRHGVQVMPGVTWVLVPDEHRLGDLLQLNNSARVLVDAYGHDLLGFTERLRQN